MSRAHTDREYEAQLRDLQNRLLLMAGHVEQMIADSVRALTERDADLARATIAHDQSVNTAEVEIDEHCLLVLARRQPMASDLRFITFVLKMVTDLERIGDLAVNICERAIDLSAQPQLRPYSDIPRMAEVCVEMIQETIQAFVDRDADKARQVIARDDEVDNLYVGVFRELLELMRTDPAAVERGIHEQSIAKWLERIGDHATNLAEQLIFMIKGKDIRHPGKLLHE